MVGLLDRAQLGPWVLDAAVLSDAVTQTPCVLAALKTPGVLAGKVAMLALSLEVPCSPLNHFTLGCTLGLTTHVATAAGSLLVLLLIFVASMLFLYHTVVLISLLFCVEDVEQLVFPQGAVE